MKKFLPNANVQSQNTKIQNGLLGLEEVLFESLDITQSAAEFMAERMKKAGMDAVADGSFLENTVHVSHRNYIPILRKRLVLEYDAQSTSELMLIDMSISAYLRNLQTSENYSRLVMEKSGTVSYNQIKINMLKELGKQIESANRQFMATLTILKEMKRPAINVKVHSKQAFIAENQQFNKNA